MRVCVNSANDCAAINGPGAGELIREAGGRPMWSPSRHAYMTNRRVASIVLALAELEGISVEYAEVAA